jgi:hypothetical protein
MEELPAGFIGTLVGMRSEVVALGLQEVCRQAFRAVGVRPTGIFCSPVKNNTIFAPHISIIDNA